MNNVAIAHKDYLVRGGGERLVESLAKSFDAPLFYGGKHGDVSLEYDDTHEVQATRKQRWFINRGGTLRSLAYMAVWQNEDRLTEYDTVITSGNEPLWYVPEPEQTIVAYCHSPPRIMYDLNHNSGRGMVGALFRAGKRTLFQHNIPRPDAWVANSEAVAHRMARYWGVSKDEISVVYPPIDTKGIQPDAASTEDWYLCLGRLAGHKRVDVAIDAMQGIGGALKIAGRGPQRERLESMARNGVELLGYVGEKQKRELYAGARAFIMPAQAEDFGMTPIEAMAAGTPVIGANEGFTQHQILDGKNGYLYDGSVGGLRAAIRRFEKNGVSWSEQKIHNFATRFNPDRFKQEMHTVVRDAQTTTEVNL